MVTTLNEQLKKLSKIELEKILHNYDSQVLDFRFSGSDFFDWVENENTKKLELFYKNQVACKDYKEICNIIPEFEKSIFLGENKRPYFVCNLENIKNAMTNGEEVAVEGGPCLFGVDEVITEIILNDNSKHIFDYSTGRKSDSTSSDILSTELELHNFVMDNAKDIKDIYFIDNKKGVTIDENESIKILFDIASCLKSKMTMPIVDMSYQKYLEYVTREVKSDIRQKAMKDFADIVHRIADLYIDVTKKIAKEYPDVTYLILHERDEELLKTYYEKRTPFIERNKVIHSLTDVPLRLEPIKDYCTMPALPYYYYGIKNILQVDCLDETDSHRKCKRAHRNTLNISALLYPERINENGMTMFNSPLKDKKYI